MTAAAGKNDSMPVTLEVTTESAGKVFVAGTFNNWDPEANPLQRVGSDGTYRARLAIPRGRHEYRFVVNGVWITDPRNPHCVPNGLGGTNSVLHVL